MHQDPKMIKIARDGMALVVAQGHLLQPLTHRRYQTPRDRAVRRPDLVSMPENSWQSAVEKFKALRGLLEMDEAKRTRAIITSLTCCKIFKATSDNG